MAHLIPPMDDEPPPDYIAFVAGRLSGLRSETARLVGGERFAPEVYTEVLTDLAGHWRRLCWRSRISHRDIPSEFLERRLQTRTRQWREEQIYPVEVSVLRPPVGQPAVDAPAMAAAGVGSSMSAGRPLTAAAAAAQYQRAPAQSVARRMAPLLPTTARAEVRVVAEAEIAWLHAYRRYVWRRYCRLGGGIVLLLGYIVQFMTQVSAQS